MSNVLSNLAHVGFINSASVSQCPYKYLLVLVTNGSSIKHPDENLPYNQFSTLLNSTLHVAAITRQFRSCIINHYHVLNCPALAHLEVCSNH